MSAKYWYRYDPQAAALYIRVVDEDRIRDIAKQREYDHNIVLDLTEGGALIGIEMLDLEADLARLVREFGLDPELLGTIDAIRQTAPHARKELILA
jgi:uncharacterized protein YuzE